MATDHSITQHPPFGDRSGGDGPENDLGSFCCVLQRFGVGLLRPAAIWGRFAVFCNDLVPFCCVLLRFGAVLLRAAAIWARFAAFCSDLVLIL